MEAKAIDEVAPYADLFITDIKQMDSAVHKKFTGVGNELILRNIKKLADREMPLLIRIPIVPGFNDTIENIDSTGDFIQNSLDNKPTLVQLLKYRPLGVEKAKTLGLPERMCKCGAKMVPKILNGLIKQHVNFPIIRGDVRNICSIVIDPVMICGDGFIRQQRLIFLRVAPSKGMRYTDIAAVHPLDFCA